MRQLVWMSRARRRDEWERWGRLLALVDARTNWDEHAKPVRPLDYWPPELIPTGPSTNSAAQPTVNRPTISMRELSQLMLNATPRGV